VAQSVWWLASIIGLEQGLITYTDILRAKDSKTIRDATQLPLYSSVNTDYSYLPSQVHFSRVPQITTEREVPATPQDLTDNLLSDQVLDRAEQFIDGSEQARNTWQRNRVNPLPQTKQQLKKARKTK
jgi:hypothetical protein